MTLFQRIQKDEGLLWSKVFEYFMVSDSALCTFDRKHPEHPNLNQVFCWAEGESATSEIREQARAKYSEVGCLGHWREIASGSTSEVALSEVYMIGGSKSQSPSEPSLEFLSSDNLVELPFLEVMKSAFSLDDAAASSFGIRMANIAEKMESQFLVALHKGEPVCCGSLFKSEENWFLMNLGTKKEHQGKGFSKQFLSFINRQVDRPIVFRTANPILEKHAGPACGFDVVARTNVVRL